MAKNTKVKKEGKKSQRERQIYWIVGVMIGVILLILFIPIFSRQLNNFEYEGLAFHKEKFDKLDVYRYTYYFSDSGKNYEYNLFLLNDPRQNKVSVNATFAYPRDKYVYISINQTGLIECPNILRDVGSLSGFYSDNRLGVKAGTPDFDVAKANNLTHVTCGNRPENPTILLQKGEVSSIIQKDNCYVATASSCEDFTNVVEKIKVNSLIDAKNKQTLQ